MAQQPPAEQPEHPQPQDDCPFLLLRTILAMTAATIMIRTALIMIVAILSKIHGSIGIPPVFIISIFTISIYIISAENACSRVLSRVK